MMADRWSSRNRPKSTPQNRQPATNWPGFADSRTFRASFTSRYSGMEGDRNLGKRAHELVAPHPRITLRLPRFELRPIPDLRPAASFEQLPRTPASIAEPALTPTPEPQSAPHASARPAAHAPYPDPHAHASSHAHAHAHSHGGAACEGSHGLFDAHQHDWSHLAMAPSSRRMLAMAFWVQLAFLILEFGGGIATHSLALLGDAAHMLADVGALALALFAARLAMRPVDSRRTWGMARAEMLAAAVNCTTLVISCGWIAYEAIHRLMEPPSIDSHGVIVIALAGLVANLVTAAILARAEQDNVNVRAAMMHTIVDAASSLGVVIAGIVIALGGPVEIDTIASMLIAVLAVRGTWPVLRMTVDSLLDAAPVGVGADDVVRVLRTAPGVVEVHDVHVWEPGPRRIAATAHILVAPGVDVGDAIVDLRALLLGELGIDHATLQIAPDRQRAIHQLQRRLPLAAAVDHAVAAILAARPTCDPAHARAAVQRFTAHRDPEQPMSPVRMATVALRELASARR